MTIQKLENQEFHIIQYHDGLFIKEYPDSDLIGFTSEIEKATKYESIWKARQAGRKFVDQIKDRPTIIPPTDITSELFPSNEKMIFIIGGFILGALTLGWLFVKAITKITMSN